MVEDVQLLTNSSCTLPGLAGVYGCRDDEGGVEIQFSNHHVYPKANSSSLLLLLPAIRRDLLLRPLSSYLVR